MKTHSLGIMSIFAGCLTCLLMVFSTAFAQEKPEREWHVSLSLEYSRRTLDGSIIRQTTITDNVYGDLMATGDSMNLGDSDAFILGLDFRYKRWGLGVNYLPTDFSGQGSALVDLGGSQVGLKIRTALNTNVNVDLLLANITYDFIQNDQMVFGVGVGFGQSSIDLGIVPAIGEPIIYSGDQPFGYLNVHMANQYKRFLYGFNVNGISATFEGVQVDYSDYTVNLGYRVIDERVKCDLMGGYRLVNFDIDIDYGQDVVAVQTTMQGPFIGVTVTY